MSDVPDSLGPLRTPERRALLSELWPTNMPSSVILRRMNELPGREIPSLQTLGHIASKWGLKRPADILAKKPSATTGFKQTASVLMLRVFPSYPPGVVTYPAGGCRWPLTCEATAIPDRKLCATHNAMLGRRA